jgi:hypothetical protein
VRIFQFEGRVLQGWIRTFKNKFLIGFFGYFFDGHQPVSGFQVDQFDALGGPALGTNLQSVLFIQNTFFRTQDNFTVIFMQSDQADHFAEFFSYFNVDQAFAAPFLQAIEG